MVAGVRTSPRQFVLINLLKGISAQLIVLHHLAFYGPMADHAQAIMPLLIDWLYDHARIAVQVFLVIGGFLAARSLSPAGLPGIRSPAHLVWRRYLKLAPPFCVAMLLAVIASAWASSWMTHDSISPAPTMAQLGAHALLLHGVLGMESLSAGAWYVAIDFQLYALMTLLAWLSGHLAGGHSPGWLLPGLVVAGVGASLLHFNLDADWDVWAPYFFGAYGLGALAWWAGDPERPPRSAALLLAAMLLLPSLALMLEFRSRIAVALATACVLYLFGRLRPAFNAGNALSAINYAGKISFSVFLVHFPVSLVVNAGFTRFVSEQAHVQAVGMLVAWVASLLAGAVFFRWVETPLGDVLSQSRRVADAPLSMPVAARPRHTGR
ncbi:acyltransferase [Massilia sp. BSC265]|uniref:acyltransferase family protein n=1 Tax=Massilia sp. BSC265 TaxID=1549812 RepID=UPI00068AFBD3|nr:acyltransferase [Massilia sp. BSC265]